MWKVIILLSKGGAWYPVKRGLGNVDFKNDCGVDEEQSLKER